MRNYPIGLDSWYYQAGV